MFSIKNGKMRTNDSGGGAGHTYSTTEQVIGNWIDGKPVYEKFIKLQSGITLNSGVWTNILDLSEISANNIIDCRLFTDIENRPFYVYLNISNNYLQAYSTVGWAVNSILLQYTKTTD